MTSESKTGGMYDNTNRGVLFRNKRKEKDSHPDHTGSLNVLGIEYWVSAWVKTSKGGEKYFSMAVTPKDKTQQQTGSMAPPTTAAGIDIDIDDDIPF